MFFGSKIFNNILYILLVALLSISLSFAQFFIPADGYQNKAECYLTLGSNPMAVLITHGNPTGPRYLQMVADLEIQSTDNEVEPQKLTRVYDLAKVEGNCVNSFIITPNGVSFSSMILNIKLFTAYGWSLLSETKYTINQNFDFNLRQLWDEDKYYGLSVEFRRSGSKFMPRSSNLPVDNVMRILNRIPANNRHLCITTPTKQRFIVIPTYPGSFPTSHISAITVGGFSYDTNALVETKSYTAYGCGTEQPLIRQDVYGVYDFNDYSIAYPQHAMGIDSSQASHMILRELARIREVYISGLLMVELIKLHQYSASVHKFYIINSFLINERCSDNSVRYTHVAKNSIRIYSYSYENDRIQAGVYRSKWVAKASTNSC